MFKPFALLFAFVLLFNNANQAQIEGDALFANNQIINIDLTFSQVSFWDSLVLGYELDEYIKADLVLTDEAGTYTFPNVGVKLKGNSSYGHPNNKKSFKIDFNRYVAAQNYDGLKKLNFSNCFKDPSMMREKVFFDFCQAANVPAPRANFANVYFNGTLRGFYTVVEQIDDQFLDWRILDDDGNLFKAGSNFGGGPGGGGDEADLKYYGTNQAAYEDLYELKSNEDVNDWTDLIELTAFIDNTSATVFENELASHIELQEYLRSAAIDNLFSNLDSYTNSARNYYIYHNLTTNKWEWIKWDSNESFGTYAAGAGVSNMTQLPINYYSANRPLLENIFNSEMLYSQYKNEICYLIDNFFNSDYMNAQIDEMKSLIQASVYADNNKMYTNANFNTNTESNVSSGGGPGGGTIYGLKSFVQQRNTYVNGQLDCELISSVADAEVVQINSYPNPFTNSITVAVENNPFSSLIIYNTLGKAVYQQSIAGSDRVEMNLSFLDNGTYFIQFFSNDSTAQYQSVLKLIKL